MASTCQYESMPDNLGPAGGISRGLTSVLDLADDDDWVVLLDDDNPPRRDDLIEALFDFAIAQAAAHPDLAMVGKTGGRFDARRGRVIRLRDDELVGAIAVDFVAGGQLPFIKVRALRAVGVFDERFFFGFDDLDFGLRLRARGYRVLVEGSVAHWARNASVNSARASPAPRVRGPFPRGGATTPSGISCTSCANGDIADAAVRVSLTTGLGRGFLLAVRHPRQGWAQVRLTIKALRDAWTGRLGRHVDPVTVRESA